MIEQAPNRHLLAVQHALHVLEQRHAEVTGGIPVIADYEEEALAS